MMCEECGEEIPRARLQALPGVSCCVRCQALRERNGKFSRHRMSETVRFSRDGSEVESIEGIVVPGGNSCSRFQKKF